MLLSSSSLTAKFVHSSFNIAQGGFECVYMSYLFINAVGVHMIPNFGGCPQKESCFQNGTDN